MDHSRRQVPQTARKSMVKVNKIFGNLLSMEWDVFISHSGRDKPAVRELASALRYAGVNVWYDEFTLRVGDSLRRSIDFGLANSRFGIVVLSPNFFAGEWTLKELDALVAREDGRQKVILPIWLGLTVDDIHRVSPLLADKVAVTWDSDLGSVVTSILNVVIDLKSNDESQHPTGQRIRRLIEEIRDDATIPEERVAATKALGRMGPAASAAVQTLVERLSDSSEDVALSAVEALEAIGPAAREAVPALAHAVVASRGYVAERAAVVLGRLGEAAAAAIPSLIIALSRHEGFLNQYAAKALADIGPLAVPALVELLKRDSIPLFAFAAIIDMGPGAAAAVPALRRLLNRTDQEIRYADVAKSLSAIGHQASEALPDLLWMLELSPNNYAAGRLAHAIIDVGMPPEAAGDVLIAALRRSGGGSVSHKIAEALARLGDIGVRHLASILAKDDEVAFDASNVLMRMDGSAEEAVPALIKMIARRDHRIYANAVCTLGNIGVPAAAAIPILIEHAKAGDSFAIEALGKIEPPRATALPTLVEVLQNPESEWFVRMRVLEAFAAYGSVAIEAKLYVELQLQDEHERVREAALKAISAMRV